MTSAIRLTSAHVPPLGRDAGSIAASFREHIVHTLGKDQYSATSRDCFWSIARATRDRMFDRWNETQRAYYDRDEKRVYYLSLEFLLGRLLDDGLTNLGMRDAAEAALRSVGCSLDDLLEYEPDAGLGNGGLGRLAACFLDSMATLGVPAMGYGIR